MSPLFALFVPSALPVVLFVMLVISFDTVGFWFVTVVWSGVTSVTPVAVFNFTVNSYAVSLSRIYPSLFPSPVSIILYVPSGNPVSVIAPCAFVPNVCCVA